MVGIRTMCWVGLDGLEPALRRFLRGRCRDDNEVDDLIQDTLMRAARYRPSLADPGRLRGWTLSIASNLLRDRARREGRQGWLERGEADERALDELAGGGDELVETDEPLWRLERGPAVGQETALQHLALAVRGLCELDRRLLRSYYGEGLSCAGAGADCGINPGLVKIRLFRARRRLERALRRSLANEPRAGGGP